MLNVDNTRNTHNTRAAGRRARRDAMALVVMTVTMMMTVTAAVVMISTDGWAAEAPRLGARVALTMGGNGEFDSGRGDDRDHQDMGGPTFTGVFTIPVIGALRVGTGFELTPERSVRIERENDDAGGRRDFGKTMALTALSEYTLPTIEGSNHSLHVTTSGGLVLAFPDHEIEQILEQAQEDGMKLGYAIAVGAGITRTLDKTLGLRLDFTVEFERIRLMKRGIVLAPANAETPEQRSGSQNFRTLRYLLSLGVDFDMT